MLDTRGDDVVAGSHEAENRHIQGIGSVERKDDAAGVVCSDEPRDRLTSPGDPVLDFACLGVGAAPCRGAQTSLITVDRLVYRVRLRPACRGVVEINTARFGHTSSGQRFGSSSE
jgi:hypothetical protein